MSPSNKCKLCLENKELIKAHVIPEGFFRILRTGQQGPHIHTNTPGRHPKRAPIGVYDKTILCNDCERTFGAWDTYAQDLLLRGFNEGWSVRQDGKVVAYQCEAYDYAKLKLFLLSVLWRASVSSHEFYQRVHLGPYEPEVRAMILDSKPGEAETFGTVLAKFVEPEATAILDPHEDRYDDVRHYRIYIGAGFLAYTKVDARPVPRSWHSLLLRPSYPLLVVPRDLHASKDGSLMKKMARDALNRHKQ